MRELVRTNNAVLITAIEALLKGADIPHMVLDRHMSVLEGSLGMLPRRIVVDAEHWAAARQVLAYLLALEAEGCVRAERIAREPTPQEAALLNPDLSKLGESAGADVIRAELGYGSAEIRRLHDARVVA